LLAPEKTGAKVDVYCHHALKSELEAYRSSQRILGTTILTDMTVGRSAITGCVIGPPKS